MRAAAVCLIKKASMHVNQKEYFLYVCVCVFYAILIQPIKIKT